MGSLTYHIFMAGLVVGSTTVYYKEGSNGTLTCHIPDNVSSLQWSGPPKGTIYTDGTSVNSMIPHHQRIGVVRNHSEYILQISDVQQIDEGNYSCLFGFNNVIRFQLLLTVQLTSVEINPSGSVTVQNSNIQQFQCSARSLPHAVITWYFNSGQISEMSNKTTNNTVTSIYNYTADKDGNGKHIHCNASSDGSIVRSLDAILDITYAPDAPLTLFPPDTAVVKTKGEHLGQIRCRADCNPSCQYEWTKDSKMVVQGDTLAIQSLAKTDHGTYRCRAWNGIGNKSIELVLTVNYGPENTYLSPANTTYTVQELTSIPVITCNTDCRPTCTKYWVGPKSQVNRSDILNLMRVERTQAGTYTCHVNNTVSSSSSISVAVIVTYGPGTSQALDPPDKSIVKIKGEEFEPVQCSARCNPACQYEWTKDNRVVVQGDTLSIQSLVKTDHGTYKCRAWNSIGNTYTTINLTVNYGPENTSLSPANTTYTVQEFTSLHVITCNTDCRPTCQKYWIGPNSQINQTDTLNIRSIGRAEAGTYRCYVNNTIRSTKTNDITVIVTYGAVISSFESNDGKFTVNDSQKINLTCLVEGVPQPKIEWTLNDKKISNQENKTNYVFTAACEDTGNYTCSARNDLDKGNLTKEFIVQCIPRILPGKSTEYKIGLKDGEGLNITVVLLAYPTPLITWNFMNSSIDANNSCGLFEHTSYLYKPVVEKTDFGIYHLSISNWLGKEEYIFSVEAQRSPDPPVIISAQCAQHTMIVFWNSSFNGGEKQTFIVAATNLATAEITTTASMEYLGNDPLNTTVKALRPGTLYDVVILAQNSHGGTRSEGKANCTTDPSESKISDITAVAAGAGTVSALIVLGIVIAGVIITRRKSGSKKSHHDKEPFQSPQNEDDDSEGLKDNPMYISSGSDFATDSAEVHSQALKFEKNDNIKQDDKSKTKQRKRNKKGKESREIELGCLYENAEDFTNQGEQIYADETKGKVINSKYLPQKNKDGLIYADLDLAPLSAERRFVINGLENKSNYAVIDLSRKADPLPSDDEDGETYIEKME